MTPQCRWQRRFTTNDGGRPLLSPQRPGVFATHGWRSAPIIIITRMTTGDESITSTTTNPGDLTYHLSPTSLIVQNLGVMLSTAPWQPNDKQQLIRCLSLSSDRHNTMMGRQRLRSTSPGNGNATRVWKRDDNDDRSRWKRRVHWFLYVLFCSIFAFGWLNLHFTVCITKCPTTPKPQDHILIPQHR